MGLFGFRSKRRVLFVDDMDSAHITVKKLLELIGFDVLDAYTGDEAISIAEKEKPDLILMDAEMPVMDGFEACRLIKQNKKTHHIPVIMCTGSSMVEDINRATMEGADSYIIKPVNEEKLKSKINSILK